MNKFTFKLAFLPALLAVTFASAQTDDDVEVTELETVHVRGVRNAARYSYTADADKTQTATKTVADVKNIPQSVSVITRRHLDEREPQDVAETLAYTSGALGGYRGENGIIEMSVRGIGNKSDGGSQPTYLNGLSYPASLEMNPYVIDRIEVLKGPASILYGQANPGGLVNLNIKEATGSNESEILFKTGTGKRIEAGVDIDRAVNHQFAYRLVAAAKKMDWQAGKVAQQKSYTIAPSLRWAPNEQTELVLNALYEKQPEAGDRNFLVSAGTVTSVNGRYIGRKFFAGDPAFHHFENEKAQIGYRFRHDFGNNLSVHQNLRYGKYTDSWKTLVVWYAVGNSSELVRKARMIDTTWHDFQVDNRVQWQPKLGSVQHNVIAGLDYAHRKSDTMGDMANAPSIDWQNPIYGVNVPNARVVTTHNSATIKQTGLYLQDQITWGSWHFLLGGRYDDANTTENNYVSQNNTKQSDHKFTWRVGALYAFNNGISPYLSYSTSFLPSVGSDVNGNLLKPTTAKQFEAGIKYQPNPSVLATASIFQINQNNLTEYDRKLGGYVQNGQVRTRGLELELQGDIMPQWGISASYTHLDKAVRESADASNVGKRSWGVPRNSFALWSDYRFSGSLRGLSAGLGMRYIGKTLDRSNLITVPAYTLWDMKIAYKPGTRFAALKGTTVQLNVQNIANKEYVASCTNMDTCFYGKGRVVTLSAGYRW